MAKPFKPITVESLGLTQEQKERVVKGLRNLREPDVLNITDSETRPEAEIEANKEP